MADLSKIKLNGTEYDLKDAFSREEINNINSNLFTADMLHDADFTSNIIYSVVKEESDNFSLRILSSLTHLSNPLDVLGFIVSWPSAADKVFLYQPLQSTPCLNLYLTDIFMNYSETNLITMFQGIKLQGVDDLYNIYTFIFEKYENGLLVGRLEKHKIVINSELATVATSGDYDDLTNKPTIPAAQVNSDWNATSGIAQILNKPNIPNVPAWALAASKPTYTAAEVGALPSTYTAPVTSVNGQTGEVNLTIPAAQVQSDWNATSGMGVILNKPNLSTFMVKGTDYVTAGQKFGTTLGNSATAEGYTTTASGDYSHAEGLSTIASGKCSHAEGSVTTASGDYSHTEGIGTTASGNYSHAEGNNTTASGDYSHAEGAITTASGSSSHTEGTGTTAQRKSQHVFGEYNILDTTGSITTKGQYVEIVGNGTSSARSNARTLDWSGNEVLAGKLTIGTAPTADMDVTTKQYVDNAITTAIGGINQFEVAIVTDLPTVNIDTHTIYFKSNSSSGNNVYDEYIYINNNWELIGSTQVDLSNYLQTSDIAAWAKATNKPTYTAAEVGALPDTTIIPAAQVNSDWNATNGIAQILNKPSIPTLEPMANVEAMLTSFGLNVSANLAPAQAGTAEVGKAVVQ